MRQFILSERVLTDNTLSVPEKGEIFKGGYVAIIQEYTFQNPWSDKETIKRFRKREALIKYLEKHYPESDICLEDTCIEN